jgi:hypothetical protein
VHLNQVCTAVPGAGDLLGNLLCAVAGLLDGGPLAGLADLLNQIWRSWPGCNPSPPRPGLPPAGPS